MTRYILTNLLLLVLVQNSICQFNHENEHDKCGDYDIKFFKSTLAAHGSSWGYGYDDLSQDIAKWEADPWIEVNSIGQSTQGRELYELTITDSEISNTGKKIVYIHSRTHPNEVQAHWVTEEIIEWLTSDTRFGETLRQNCIIYIVPMYNPDGVELEFPRENANSIDIESNWDTINPEKEVGYLKARFTDLMSSDNSVKIALNMHSAYACKRYFVYHHENGTSPEFAEQEQFFINSVRNQFYDGIEPWSYFVSWVNSTPKRYPESWWWNNYGKDVMALTYEDMNCSSSGFYKKTAYSILHGISDYLNLGYVNSIEDWDFTSLNLKVYPNPMSENAKIEWNTYEKAVNVSIRDINGRILKEFSKSFIGNGYVIWDGTDNDGNTIKAGLYIANVQTSKSSVNRMIIKH